MMMSGKDFFVSVARANIVRVLYILLTLMICVLCLCRAVTRSSYAGASGTAGVAVQQWLQFAASVRRQRLFDAYRSAARQQ